MTSEVVLPSAAGVPPTAGGWKVYPAYRDSGVEWLGEIPEHWAVKRLKDIAVMNPDSLGETTSPDYELLYVDITNVDSAGRLLGMEELRFENAPTRARRRVKHGDTIISTVRTYLKAIAFIDEPPDNLIVSTGFAVLRPCSDILPSFLPSLLQAEPFIQDVVAHSEGVGYPAISPSRLASLPVWVPPLPEQRAIAAFLDRETAKIDALAVKKERLIELLQEKRAAVISQAVTKGLDPEAPMKDSGVEWIGEIPAHWEVKKIKRLCLVKRGASPRPIDDPVYFDDEGTHAWVRISDVTSAGKYLRSTEQRLSALGVSKSVCLEPGDLFLSIAATVGKPVITQILCCIHDGFVYFEGLGEDHEYLYYLFSGGGLYAGLGKIGTQLNLNTDTVGDIHVPVPPREEQQSIAAYLSAGGTRLSALIMKVRSQIEELQEFRKALTSAAVTGKIDVRDEVK